MSHASPPSLEVTIRSRTDMHSPSGRYTREDSQAGLHIPFNASRIRSAYQTDVIIGSTRDLVVLIVQSLDLPLKVVQHRKYPSLTLTPQPLRSRCSRPSRPSVQDRRLRSQFHFPHYALAFPHLPLLLDPLQSLAQPLHLEINHSQPPPHPLNQPSVQCPTPSSLTLPRTARTLPLGNPNDFPRALDEPSSVVQGFFGGRGDLTRLNCHDGSR